MLSLQLRAQCFTSSGSVRRLPAQHYLRCTACLLTREVARWGLHPAVGSARQVVQADCLCMCCRSCYAPRQRHASASEEAPTCLSKSTS